MRYVTQESAERHHLDLTVANISHHGSVRGMREKFGWPKDGQIRVGGYIYNVGVAEVDRMRHVGVLRGEKT